MRRLALLSMVLLVLVAACGGETEPVEVSGNTGGFSESGDSFSEEGLTYTGNWTDVSDERLQGQNEAVTFCKWISEGERSAECEGTFEIMNDGGTWEGAFTGTSLGGVHNIQGTLLGTGGYEGLQFTYQLEGVGFPWTITGTIEPVDS